MLGESSQLIPISSQIRLASDKNDWCRGADGTDLGAPEVEGGEQGGGVRALVAEEEDIGVPVGQAAGVVVAC